MGVASEDVFTRPSQFFYQVVAGDCDKYNHLNHASSFQILERARWKALGDWDHAEDEVIKSGIGPVIISIKAEFRKEIRMNESLEVFTHAELLNRRFFYIHQRVEVNKILRLRATFKHGLFSLDTRSLVLIPESWSRIF